MSDGPLSAEEVEHRRFALSFRGFDPAEVRSYLNRVAEELRSSVQRERELQRRLADAEYRAAHPVVDEAVVTRVLGEETSRVLASAHDVANELRAKAEENAARILREANEEADRIRAQAEGLLAERTEEAEAAAGEIRAGAQSEAQGTLERARQEVETRLAEAQAHGDRLVQEAEAGRSRVLADLTRKRRIAHVQVEQLRAGRDRLLEAYRVVRRTLDEVVAELERAEPEARQAAEAVARRFGVQQQGGEGPGAAEDYLVEPEVDLREGGQAAPAPEPVPVPAPGPAEALAGEEEGGLEAPEEASQRRPFSSLRVIRPPRPERTAPAEPAVAGMPALEEGVRVLGPHRAPDPAAPETTTPAAGRGTQAPGTAPAAPAAEPGPAPVATEVPAPALFEDGGREPEPSSGTAAPVTSEAPGSIVDDLFARLRADRAAAVARAHDVLAAEELAAAPEDAAAQEGPPHTAVGDGADAALLERREAALATVWADLARRLKRALQDEQNEVLDRLRSARGRPAAVGVLPPGDEQVSRYRTVSQRFLEEAAVAGAQFYCPDASVRPDVSELAAHLAEALVEPLRRRLEQGIDGGAQEDPSVVVERVGAAYRECKAQRIDRLAADSAIGAFSRGTVAGLAGTPLRWVVNDEDGGCPDCDDNALAGPTTGGEAYPTGQLHPPAHAGCRCLLVPASP